MNDRVVCSKRSFQLDFATGRAAVGIGTKIRVRKQLMVLIDHLKYGNERSLAALGAFLQNALLPGVQNLAKMTLGEWCTRKGICYIGNYCASKTHLTQLAHKRLVCEQ